jgi:hypothetical protein
MWPSAEEAKAQARYALQRIQHLDRDPNPQVQGMNWNAIPQPVDVGDGGFRMMGTTWPGPATIHGLEWTVHSNDITMITLSVGRFSVAMEFWSASSPDPDVTDRTVNQSGALSVAQEQSTHLPR